MENASPQGLGDAAAAPHPISDVYDNTVATHGLGRQGGLVATQFARGSPGDCGLEETDAGKFPNRGIPDSEKKEHTRVGVQDSHPGKEQQGRDVYKLHHRDPGKHNQTRGEPPDLSIPIACSLPAESARCLMTKSVY